MSTQHVETLIIGAGQAGLATAYHLQQRGRECLVVDGIDRIGDNWRCHYDSLRLFTPAKYDGLPGMDWPGDPWHFPGRDEVADYLERYAVEMDLPVRLQTRVDRLERVPGDRYVAHLGEERITCRNVVVATGTRGRTPYLPQVADRLDPSIRQLHSSDYKRPSQVTGPALVVGTSTSGCEIAYELAGEMPVVLSGRNPGKEPHRPGTRGDRLFTPLLFFVATKVLTRRNPLGRKVMRLQRGPHHGVPMARVRAEDLAARGVDWHRARVTEVSADGRPVLADGTVVDVRTVVWCTGYRVDFGWIDLPVFDDQGWPREYRGVVDEAPGLFFCGLVFQYALASQVLPGVGRDAAYVADSIAARRPDRQVVPS